MLTATARRWLSRATASDADPTLGAEEISDLLRFSARLDIYGVRPDGYDDWQPAISYAVGDIVAPDPRNNHFYICTTAGVSTGVAPTWTTSDGDTVTDGTELVWTEAGATGWTPTYDLNAGAAEGWRWKQGKLAGTYQFKTDGGEFNKQQVFDHCEKMAGMYQKRARTARIGSIKTTNYNYLDPVTGDLIEFVPEEEYAENLDTSVSFDV